MNQEHDFIMSHCISLVVEISPDQPTDYSFPIVPVKQGNPGLSNGDAHPNQASRANQAFLLDALRGNLF
jgi:hypothetical protein